METFMNQIKAVYTQIWTKAMIFQEKKQITLGQLFVLIRNLTQATFLHAGIYKMSFQHIPFVALSENLSSYSDNAILISLCVILGFQNVY